MTAHSIHRNPHVMGNRPAWHGKLQVERPKGEPSILAGSAMLIALGIIATLLIAALPEFVA